MDDRTMPFKNMTDPIIRSAVYGMLSLAFKYPTPGAFEGYRNGDYPAALWERISALPHLEGLVDTTAALKIKIPRDLEGIGFQDFEVGYTRNFDVGAPAPPCPPYEGIYRKGVERTALMIEVSEFYKCFGLSMNDEEDKRELPDHLCAELEFLHFLTFKEAQAMEERTPEMLRGYVLAQKDFIERHILSWLPSFCKKLESSTKLPFFSDMARIALSFASAEARRVRARLRELNPFGV